MFSPLVAASLVALAAIPFSRAAVLEVTVGGPGVLQFQPDFVNAVPGDIVRFTFQQKNHTVTQSTLAAPCSYMPGGFDSGFIPVGDDAVDFPVAELEIHDTEPIWAYCRQGAHCSQGGMVFAVNPGDQMDQFRAAATNPGGVASTSSVVVPLSTPTEPAATAAATPAASQAAGASGVDHKIVVGGPGSLLFNPSNIAAAIGDTVTFEFRQKSHSATQSTFADPCSPLQDGASQGFDSGLMPVADGVTDGFPTYTISINNTNAIWGYCRQATHCQQGMVFSINAEEQGDKTFEAFRDAAMSASTSSATSDTNSALPLGNNNAGIVVALIGAIFGSMLL